MSDSSLFLKGFGKLAQKWAGDLRFRDLFLDIMRDDGTRKYRVPLHDSVAQPLLTWMANGGATNLLKDIIRSVYSRNNDESFVLKSIPEDDFEIGIRHLKRVPGLEREVSRLVAMHKDDAKKYKLKKDTKVKSFPLGGSLGASVINDLILDKVA